MVAAKGGSVTWGKKLKIKFTDTGYMFSQVEIESHQRRHVKSLAGTVNLLWASESTVEAGIPARRPKNRLPSLEEDGK